MRKKSTGKTMPNFADRIRELRGEMGMSQGDFAEALGVVQSLVSACEAGEKRPSTDLLVKLGRLAAKDVRYVEALWFWRNAGIDQAVLDAIADMRLKRLTTEPGVNVELRELSESGETLVFPASLVANPASTRFLRVSGISRPFEDGDILLIDPLETDLSVLEGTYIAVQTVSNHILVGSVFAMSVGAGYRHYVLETTANAGADRQIIGIRDEHGSLQMMNRLIVRGRVVGWISPAEKKDKEKKS